MRVSCQSFPVVMTLAPIALPARCTLYRALSVGNIYRDYIRITVYYSIIPPLGTYV